MNDPTRNSDVWHGTTILTVRKGGRVVIAGDGQVSLGATVIKANARKVRSLGKGDVIGGFAGATSRCLHAIRAAGEQARTISSQLTRACVELAKDWRTDRYLRRLEAMMIVADRQVSLVLTGTGRCAGAGRRRHGHRFGRATRARGRQGADGYEPGCGGHRAQSDGHRGGDLRYTNTKLVIESLESA